MGKLRRRWRGSTQAIWQTSAYVPALLGRGEALLVADRVDDAIAVFKRRW